MCPPAGAMLASTGQTPLVVVATSAYPASDPHHACDAEDGMRQLALALAALVLLVGCSSTIKLQHPDGRRAECGSSYMYGIHSFAAQARDRDCVSDYQRQGYERVPN